MEKNNQVPSKEQLISLFESSSEVNLSCKGVIEDYLLIWSIFILVYRVGKHLGDAGAQAICDALKINSSLQFLYLNSMMNNF